MGTLVVYGSEDCPGWSEVQPVLRDFRETTGPETTVRVKDPVEHAEEFYGHGLVVCPSILYEGELIVVGVPTLSELKEKTADSSPVS